jgi:NADH-quinone oxidoreductase subunit L
LLPLIGAPLVPLVGFLSDKACKWFATAVSGLTAAVAVYSALTFQGSYYESFSGWLPTLSIPIEVNVDGLSVLLSAFVASLSFVIIFYSVGNMRHEEGQARFYSLVLLFVGAMLGLVMAGNLVQLYFFWEIVGICSAFLIAFWNKKEVARKAGMKAFIVTRFGDVGLLLGVLLILTTIHTANFGAITAAISGQQASGTWTLIGFLVLFGAMGKSAQVPLQTWLPDAMEGPTPVSALIHAATMVNAGVYLVARLFPLFNSSSLLLAAVTSVGLLSMVVGAASASAAEDLKRVLAYSTISQLGLMFVAIGVGSWMGAIYQLISQGLFKALAFMSAGSVIEATGTRKMDEMGGLRRSMKYTYVAFLVAALAMVGFPPLIGFWTKDAILSSAYASSIPVFLVIVAASIFTSFYSFRALIKTFYGAQKSEAKESTPLMVGPMVVLSVAVVVGWLLLSSQNLVPLQSAGFSAPVLLGSLSALVVGLLAAYYGFSARREATQMLFQRNGVLRATRSFLLSGFGFDRFYWFVISSVGPPLVRGATALQTGILGKNLALLISALLVLILLTVTGVI